MAKYIRRYAVSERYGIPASTLYDWIAKGQFPKPVRLGVRTVAWEVTELDAWESTRKAKCGA
jgi:prophage regulatory protein